MAYEKNTWKTGDIVTSAKLNHMEDGIAGAGGVMVLHTSQDGDGTTLDKTWQEIYDAFNSGTVIRVFTGNYSSPEDFYVSYDEVSAVTLYNGSYSVGVSSNGQQSGPFIASNANDYPSFTLA